MIGQFASLGVKVHVTDRFEPSKLPAALRADKRVIVVAFDASTESQHSLGWALKNVFRPESDFLILLSVAIFQEPMSFAAISQSVQDKSEHKTAFAEEYSSKLSTVASGILEEHKVKEGIKVFIFR